MKMAYYTLHQHSEEDNNIFVIDCLFVYSLLKYL